MAKSNSPAKSGDNSNAALKAFVSRIETLDEERQARSGDIREVYAEAKGQGFDAGALRQIIRERKQDKDKLAEREAIVEVYRVALDMVPTGVPLGAREGLTDVK